MTHMYPHHRLVEDKLSFAIQYTMQFEARAWKISPGTVRMDDVYRTIIFENTTSRTATLPELTI